MTPTSFTFSLTMPGDDRFVEAIRLLAVQAASYVKLSGEAGDALAAEVERATTAALAATGGSGGPIELTFSGDEQQVTVVIACQAAGPIPAPDDAGASGASVRWSTEGTRLTCRIEQPTAA
jgi:hypothetical protein